MTISASFRLGEWLVQPALNTIERDDQVVRIEPRYMNLLIYLAERGKEVVSADQIHDNVWAGMVVGDHSVYQGIARLPAWP